MKNHKIIIIAPLYNNYGEQIRDAFVRNECEVELVQYDEYLLINTSFGIRIIKAALRIKWMRFLKKWLIRDMIFKGLNLYICDHISGLSRNSFDFALCIKFDGVDMNNIQAIKRLARKTFLYLYDPVERYDAILNNFAAFDRIATFSKIDSIKYDIAYIDLLPISNEKTANCAPLLYYSCFIGEFSLCRFVSILSLPLRFLFKSKVILVNSALQKARFNFGFIEFRGERLDKKTINEIYDSSASFLEVMNTDQFDNTPRFHEAKSYGKALICNSNLQTLKYDLNFKDIKKIMKNLNIHTPDEFLRSYKKIYKPHLTESQLGRNEVRLQDEFVLKIINIFNGYEA